MAHPAIKPTLLLCIIALAVACYLPGLTGHFIFDDGVNIRLNPLLRIDSLDFSTLWQAASSGGTRPLSRPISMASFALDFYFFGMSPYYFKATNLAIHLANGLLVFVLVKLLLGLHLRIRGAADNNTASWIGIAVAAIWLLHPFNLTGVLYVVQRMTSLAALFTLAGLALYMYGRKKLLDGNKSGFFAMGAALFVFTPLAALCKERTLVACADPGLRSDPCCAGAHLTGVLAASWRRCLACPSLYRFCSVYIFYRETPT
ncbi:MAG: hypothetical protein IPN64_12110 [Propionivibrio sp.]|uniref:hypothetical protein n=1 Tax=Propionivibrio sp. TaxID=2212460 RepID=UPI0025D7E68B|nr:hypothetical protein [Propionivibrio sp.]MBK8894756.1 hypothetical protein [Propionivibrio sp.]